MKACFFAESPENRLNFVFAQRRDRFAQYLDLLDEPVLLSQLDEKKELLQEVEVILSTWGIPALTEDQVRTYFPNLKLLLYSAASVRYFAEGYLKAGVTVVTAAQAMADFVAQYSVAAIYHLNKGFYTAARLYREKGYRTGKDFAQNESPGNYESRIGILGAGAIGSRVIKQLKAYPFEILVFDPFLPPEKAKEWNVRLTSLEEIFATCDVVSNHLANNPQTVDMLDYKLFSSMPKHATFLNTGRGAQVVEADLARALREEPGRFALLDVTRQEPCPPDHEFWSLQNLLMTPHIAGVGFKEVWAYDDLLLEELQRYLEGKSLRHAVTLDMLATMA